MDALEELSNMYGASSQGSGTFNKANNPSMTRFGDNEGADVLRMYPGEGRSYSSNSPAKNRGGFIDNLIQEPQNQFGIDRHKDNYNRANNFIDNYVPRVYHGEGRAGDDTASFEKYSGHGGNYNEPYEDILDSIKGDTYSRAEDTGRFRGGQPNDRQGSRRNQDYGERRGGPISVEAQSIPDFERSQASSRDEDLRSMQPQGFRFTGNSWNKPGTNNRGISSGEGGKRSSKYRGDTSHSGIDVIGSSASRRQRTVDPKNKRGTDDVPIFLAKNPSHGGSRPPLHKNMSMIEEDDKLSQLNRRDGGPRSGRFREGDKDDASDVTSRRRYGDDTSFKGDQSGIPALESSVSRRSGRMIGGSKNTRPKEPDLARKGVRLI